MPSFIIALVIVFGGLWLIRTFARATPAQSKGLSKKLAGGALIVVSAVLALTGKAQFAAPLFAIGLALIGHASAFPNGFPWASKSAGQKSRVATSILAMELDHDTGTMDGAALVGPSKGKRLSAMSEGELQSFHALCGTSRDQSWPCLRPGSTATGENGGQPGGWVVRQPARHPVPCRRTKRAPYWVSKPAPQRKRCGQRIAG